jgi:hypothetical protein
MQGRIFVGFLMCSLFFVVGGDAQRPNITEKPVWTLEFIKPRPEKFGLTLRYLDDHWMRVRKEAKRQGAVLIYRRISETFVIPPDSKPGDETIVLLTEYKNPAVYLGREKLFASMLERLPGGTPGVFSAAEGQDLYETVDSRVFLEEPDDASGTQFKLLTRR